MAQVRCHVLGFLVQLSNISFEKLVDLKGIAGFAQDVSPITMQKVTKAEGDLDQIRALVGKRIKQLHADERIFGLPNLDMPHRVLERPTFVEGFWTFFGRFASRTCPPFGHNSAHQCDKSLVLGC